LRTGTIRIGADDFHQPVAVVVLILGDIAERVGHQPLVAREVIRHRRDRRGERAAAIRIRTRNRNQLIENVIAKFRLAPVGVGFADQVPGFIVFAIKNGRTALWLAPVSAHGEPCTDLRDVPDLPG
jgi:hypothetical protein